MRRGISDVSAEVRKIGMQIVDKLIPYVLTVPVLEGPALSITPYPSPKYSLIHLITSQTSKRQVVGEKIAGKQEI